MVLISLTCTDINVQCSMFNFQGSTKMNVKMNNININRGDDFGKGKYCERKVL